MQGNIAFIGGIHGAGKGTVCQNLCAKIGFTCLSAGALLKWAEMNEDKTNKLVSDIDHTQERLLVGLSAIVEQGHRYLLDGHYCLLDNNGQPSKLPLHVFEEINPVSLHLIVDGILKIKERLEGRDGRQYDVEMLHKLQQHEKVYAEELSRHLNVPLNIGTPHQFSSITHAPKSFAQ